MGTTLAVLRTLAAFTLLLMTTATAHAAPNLLVGVTEDGFKTEPQAALADARKLGIGAFRITLRWRPGLTAPTREQAAELRRATQAASDLAIVLTVFGERAVDAPTTDQRRDQYCDFLGAIVRRYEPIRHVTIWNEPNKTFFWRPQFHPDGSSAAPAAYAELLARCWDVLHDASPDVKVIAPSTAPRGNDNPDAASNVSHSPTKFVQELARAYRSSGRDAPLFDVVGHHVHAIHSAERPWRAHAGSGVTQGDLAKLEKALAEAFAGTSQPVPGRCIDGNCVPIWLLEAGFQTRPDARKASLYTGFEISPRPLPDKTGDVALEPLPDSGSLAPDQATQIVSALRLAYCQPHVEAFFNFLLWDEQRLEGWQSAPLWFDRTPKGSYSAFRNAIRQVKEEEIECDGLTRAVEAETMRAAARAARTAGSASPPAPPSAAPGPPSPPEGSAAPQPARGESADDAVPVWLIVTAAGAAALLAGGSLLYLRRRRGGETR
jgi:hypothetical protein